MHLCGQTDRWSLFWKQKRLCWFSAQLFWTRRQSGLYFPSVSLFPRNCSSQWLVYTCLKKPTIYHHPHNPHINRLPKTRIVLFVAFQTYPLLYLILSLYCSFWPHFKAQGVLKGVGFICNIYYVSISNCCRFLLSVLICQMIIHFIYLLCDVLNAKPTQSLLEYIFYSVSFWQTAGKELGFFPHWPSVTPSVVFQFHADLHLQTDKKGQLDNYGILKPCENATDNFSPTRHTKADCFEEWGKNGTKKEKDVCTLWYGAQTAGFTSAHTGTNREENKNGLFSTLAGCGH